MPETLFDFLNRENDDHYQLADESALEEKVSTPEIAGRVPGGRERAVDLLQHAGWYVERLAAMPFSVEELAVSVRNPDNRIPLEDLLASYGRHLAAVEGSPLYDLDRDILRLEMRRLTRAANRRLSEEVTYRLPGPHDYRHERFCPYGRQEDDYAYAGLDYVKPLSYKDQQAIVIINAVGCQALFERSSAETVAEIFKRSLQSSGERRSREEMEGAGLYDVLPVQHLIARIWSVNGLRRFMTRSEGVDIGTAAKHFEDLNRHARRALKRPEVCRADLLHVSMFYDVRTIKETEDRLLIHHCRQYPWAA